MNDQQGQIPQYQSGNISSQQHPHYTAPPVQNCVSPQQPQWPPQQYPNQTQYNHPQLSQYPPQYVPQWQQPPSQPLSPQFMQPIPPQITNKEHSKKKIGFIIASATILIITFILGIAVGANLKGSSTSWLSSSTSIPSNSTSTSNSILSINGTNPAKAGDTISVGSVGCTLVSVTPNPLPGDAITMPKIGDEFIVVNVKLTNTGVSNIDYHTINFYARSSSVNTIPAVFGAPSSYTSNNLPDNNGTIAPGNSVQGDVILQVPIGDRNAELLWEPYWGNNSSNNLWNLGL